MAVVKSVVDSRLQLEVVVDTDQNGNPVIRKRSYGNIKTDAPDQDVHDVGLVLSELQEYPLYAINRIDTGALVEV